MATLDPCPDNVNELVDRLVQQNHQGTLDGVQIQSLFVYATKDKEGQPKGPAIKYSRQQADSKTVIVKAENRLTGGPDVIIQLDGDRWNDWSAKEQAAVIDEALERIEPVFSEEDDDGNVDQELDDSGRPKLRIRDYDMTVTGFKSIAERHGADSPFVRKAEGFVKDFSVITPYGDSNGQIVLDSGDDEVSEENGSGNEEED